MKANDAKRLKELERENQQLKRIVADQVLENRRSRRADPFKHRDNMDCWSVRSER